MCFYLQYKMFLLNSIAFNKLKDYDRFTIQNVSIKSLLSLSNLSCVKDLQYKMFLLNYI